MYAGSMVLLPEGGDLTLSELREIAAKQQQQIEAQQQLVIAKVQRLKFLKQQEARHHQEVQTTENERLRYFQERLEAQELKLRRLRTLNGQIEQYRTNNNKLSSELESVRLLFGEKEKELSAAIEKVGELALQLEELRKGNLNELKNNDASVLSSSQELAKLRHELLYHAKLTEQQSIRISQQRKLLAQRQEEVLHADQKIWELKQRLHRKQLHNQQLSKQLQTATSTPKSSAIKQLRPLNGNIATVEPVRRSQDQERSQDDLHANLTTFDGFNEFFPNKNDPKYQTLPYNTKFTVRNGTYDETDATIHKLDTRPVPFVTTDTEKENMVLAKPVPTSDISSSNIMPNKLYSSPSKLNHFSPRPYEPIHTISHTSSVNPVTSAVSSPGSNIMAVVHPVIASTNNPVVLTSSSPLSVSTNATVPFSYTSSKINNVCNNVLNRSEKTTLDKSHNVPSSVTPVTNVPIPLTSKSSINRTESNKINSTDSNNSNNNKPIVPPKPVKPLLPPRQIYIEGSNTEKPDNVDVALAVLRNSGLETVSSSRYSLKPGITKSNRLEKKEQVKQEETSSTDSETTVGNSREDGVQKRTVIGQLPIQPKPLTIKKPMCVKPPRLRSNIPVLSSYKRSFETNLQSHPILQFNKYSLNHKTDLSTETNRVCNDITISEKDTGSISNTNINDRLSEVIDNVPPFVNEEKTKEETQSKEEIHVKGNRNDISELQLDTSKEFSNYNEVIETDNENVRTEGDGDSGCETVPPNNSCETKSTLEILPPENSTAEHECVALRRVKKGNLKTKDSAKSIRRVSFDPLALLLDAALEGEVELVKKTACEVPNPSAANDEGITALHNAICAGHLEIVTFLVELGCDVNTQDSDGWTPLHCAASCNNLPMVKYLVEHGACIFATTLSDHETAAEKCEEDEDGFDGCSEYLYGIQEKLGVINGGVVYAVYDYELQNPDELSFEDGNEIIVLKKGDEVEREWWWSKLNNQEGYVPRNLLGLYPRVTVKKK